MLREIVNVLKLDNHEDEVLQPLGISAAIAIAYACHYEWGIAKIAMLLTIAAVVACVFWGLTLDPSGRRKIRRWLGEPE